MSLEPSSKKAIVFIDGQNLFHAAREAFGHSYPNYDARKLAQRICSDQGWDLVQVRFYTGIPDSKDEPFWNHFWTHKLAQMGRQRVYTYQRALRYHSRSIRLPDGTEHTYRAGHEKGIDIRLALDVVGLALDEALDVALVFSQDQDLSEVADEIRRVARRQGRWIKMASAFPVGAGTVNTRGIDKTDWIRIDQATFDSCLDPRDYRPRQG